MVYNRLDQGMPLQFDSTVHYATGKDGSVGTSDEDRGSDSAYNTYKVTGLPPTPITAPGEKAIKAALDAGRRARGSTSSPPTRTRVRRSSPTTYAEHQKNVAEFNEWCAQSDNC